MTSTIPRRLPIQVFSHRLFLSRFGAYYYILLLLLLLLARLHVDAEIGADGKCRLVVFVPFTYEDEGISYLSSNGTLTGNLGYSHMAAALLAMEQFNQRNSSVVPELAQPVFQDCTVQFDLNTSSVYNEGAVTHTAGQSLFQDVLDDGHHPLPCAMAGPYNDIPAEDLSVWAVSARIPLVAARAFNTRVTHPLFAPYSSQVYPNQAANAQVLVKFLQRIGRDNYTAILYNVGDTATQHQEIVSLALEEASITYRSYRYILPSNLSIDSTLVNVDVNREQDDLFSACRRIQADGFRTIVAITEFHEVETGIIADAAEEHGLNEGEHVWIFLGVDISVYGSSPVDLNNERIVKLLAGAALLTPVEKYLLDREKDPFFRSWFHQTADFVDRVNRLHPFRNDPNQSGYFHAPPDFFQTADSLQAGAAFVYDAVMTIGMGACLAQQQQQKKGVLNITGMEHVKGIRSVDFQGATGRVKIGDGDSFPGVRNSNFVRHVVVDMFPPLVGERFDNGWFDRIFHQTVVNRTNLRVPYVLDSQGLPLSEATFEEVELEEIGYPYIYRSGLPEPPILLRTPPNQNYLSKGMRVTGLVLFSMVAISSLVCGLWVYLRRKHRVVCAAQPYSLYLVCFGSFLTSLTILCVSFDESTGWSEQKLSRACMSVPWLVSLGQIITYGALFCKLWRVNKVLQFHKAVVQVRHVAWPAILLMACTIAWLTFITVVHPLYWERVVIDEDTGESIGRCANNSSGLVDVLGLFMFIPMVLTAFMAWKTNDVDDALSESWWIFSLMATQFEVILLSVTLVGTLRNLDTNGRYFGIVFMLWTFPASQLILIILPKIVAYRKAIHAPSKVRRRGRTSGEVRVSGLYSSTATTDDRNLASAHNDKIRSSIEAKPYDSTHGRDFSEGHEQSEHEALSECCENNHGKLEESKSSPTESPLILEGNGASLNSEIGGIDRNVV